MPKASSTNIAHGSAFGFILKIKLKAANARIKKTTSRE